MRNTNAAQAALRRSESAIEETSDEDHIPSRGAIARVITCDAKRRLRSEAAKMSLEHRHMAFHIQWRN